MIYDIIIVGSGPAGLTAGLYSVRAGFNVLLIDGYPLTSQVLTTSLIENYPGFPEGISGIELINKFKQQAEKFGLQIKNGIVKNITCVNNIWQVEINEKKYNCLSLIIATGARPKKLEVKGEERFQGKGVSYCATCDGPLYKNKEIIVVGGGNSAIEETLFLSKFAKKIIVVHRREKLRAIKILQERILKCEKVKFIWNSYVTEIIGDKNVKEVKIENVKTKEQLNIYCNGIFIFIGHVPNTEFLTDLLVLDKNGYIVTDDNMNTSCNGIFACGDCRSGSIHQIITSCSEGTKAAFTAQNYVEKII